ncbi:hypothetical protein ACA910_022226 [Epithemia clementina (nom. ined.)]
MKANERSPPNLQRTAVKLEEKHDNDDDDGEEDGKPPARHHEQSDESTVEKHEHDQQQQFTDSHYSLPGSYDSTRVASTTGTTGIATELDAHSTQLLREGSGQGDGRAQPGGEPRAARWTTTTSHNRTEAQARFSSSSLPQQQEQQDQQTEASSSSLEPAASGSPPKKRRTNRDVNTEANSYRMIQELERFKADHGHCDVPQSQGALGHWVRRIRMLKKEFDEMGYFTSPTLNHDLVRRLNQLGFNWVIFRKGEDNWRQHFEELRLFHDRGMVTASWGPRTDPWDGG